MTEPGCPGFRFSGIAAGIKKNGKEDLGLIVSETPASVAAVFTRNRVKAAPVLLDQERIQAGECLAVIANSGNANCCTGEQGFKDAESMAKLTAEALGIPEDKTLVASTGVIGEPMPMETITSAIPKVVDALGTTQVRAFAKAIMTTDTVPKTVYKEELIGGRPVALIGIVKGAGMIRPDMATMLCFICSDIQASAGRLQELLSSATEQSFNRITIDGDTSTNDTVLLMANGLSGISVDTADHAERFQRVLAELMVQLAREVVKDGEGVTKLVDVVVEGADSPQVARAVADTVAHSSLVKTAFFGEDANWGRILGAVGRAGVPVDPDRIDVYFGDVQMVKSGVGCGKDVELAATEVLRKPEFSVVIDLNQGNSTASVITSDLSVEYVKINADYRT
ncbi:Glutamate N-acetyltransferase (EC @ N-acetylglutamate synthase (EC [Olavius algarvensis associated proteobacterium Delta 3]|nr:Glutamate N-acetyltransferase (EC @ N-acetylglutamate synthase (EC [Olavius algarvensis associated proteobacterium Delta 3]CAB5112648.1 Glutamate N-acetyltransferase (EC @ N-acetylglutamate synthase (EC [Olavius algarvensis associated proteobacterium Delta 3]